MLAVHAYFKPTNFESEKTLFLAGDIALPRFTYRSYREDELKESDRLFVNTSLLVREKPTKENIDTFRKLNHQFYGEPDKVLARGIVTNIKAKTNTSTKTNLWGEVKALLDKSILETSTLPVVDVSVFAHYKQYFACYTDHHFLKTDLKNTDLSTLISSTLKQAGLTDKGWSLLIKKDATHARVNHDKRRVILGKHYHTRSNSAKARIASHEVYGHALRGKIPSPQESEGFAIVLEQLVGSGFKYRRAYRYLAGFLAYEGMSFREVFEIIWRLMVIGSEYSKENARSHAFNECSRIFRGGLMDGHGAVFLKDTIYFEANLKIWKLLSEELLTYESFVDMIEGRRMVL